MVPMTGRAIGQGMGQGIMRFLNSGLEGEIIYSFVIILCSLMIYFGTTEFYKLSYHKGIKYFRLSFLFFALAYFFRSFIKIILFYIEKIELVRILPIFGAVTLFVFIYFSSMAIFYLLYSVMCKKWEHKLTIYLFHIISLIITIIIILFRNPFTYILINILLLLFILFVVHFSRKKSNKKKSNNLYFIYIMLFIFWILNIVDVLIPVLLKTFKLFIYLISLVVFLLIFYKVIRKTG